MSQSKKKVWFDVENSPHILLLKPFIEIAHKQGYEVVVTARNIPEIVNLCRMHGLKVRFISNLRPKNRILKPGATFMRALKLYFFIRKKNVSFSLSNSRSCALASFFLGLKSFIITDYEWAEMRVFAFARSYLILPSLIPTRRMEKRRFPPARLLRFQGLKEYIYLDDSYPFLPPEKLGLSLEADEVVAVVRPECRSAHYWNRKTSEKEKRLWQAFSGLKEVRFIIIPRDKKQRDYLRSVVSALSLKAIVLDKVVDGPSLVRAADLVLCGGGTMAREAAVLGTPAYSYFSGRTCAVDDYLIRKGLLIPLNDNGSFSRIRWEKKKCKHGLRREVSPHLAAQIWGQVLHYNILSEKKG